MYQDTRDYELAAATLHGGRRLPFPRHLELAERRLLRGGDAALPGRRRTARLLRTRVRRALDPMSHFYCGTGGLRQVRLACGQLTPDLIETGLDRFAAFVAARCV